MSIIKDSNLANVGIQKIEWVKDFMPVLTHLGDEFAKTRPFKGLKIGMSIHLEAKTAYLALTLKAGGAEVFATGCKDVITREHFRVMRDNAFLANAGHFDVEINLKDLAEESCKIYSRRENITGYVILAYSD